MEIFEDGIKVEVNGVGMVTHRKVLTPAQKKVYRKHHRVTLGSEGLTPSYILCMNIWHPLWGPNKNFPSHTLASISLYLMRFNTVTKGSH